MDALVLAGGLGTRLRSRVPHLPKPMAPVGGRPFLEHVLDGLRGAGVDRVVLSVGHLGGAVTAHFGSSYHELVVDYVVEDVPLGTGGAIRAALPSLGPPFLVVNGDTSVPIDLGALHGAHAAHGDGLVLSVVAVADVARFGCVRTAGDRVVGLVEKGGVVGPGLINAGAYLVGPPLVEHLRRMPEIFSFERDVLEPWVEQYGAPYVEAAGPFVDIGVPADYDRAADVLADVRADVRTGHDGVRVT